MNLFKTVIKLLTFRLTREEMLKFNMKHFYLALIGAWLVGMGRYWDDSGANLLQHLGLVSVIYIFALALFIWVILIPFKIKNWSYFTVVTFIGLTSFPAILYAIPVEKFFPLATSNTINVWFLAIVAAWRLALLYYFLKHFTELSRSSIITVTLMPMCIIISILTMLNLHRAVFSIMGGVSNPTPHDVSYKVLLVLTGISLLLSIPLLIAYGFEIYYRRKELRTRKSNKAKLRM